MTFMNYVLMNPLASTITEYETVVYQARLCFPGTDIPELYLEHCLVLIKSFICLSGFMTSASPVSASAGSASRVLARLLLGSEGEPAELSTIRPPS